MQRPIQAGLPCIQEIDISDNFVCYVTQISWSNCLEDHSRMSMMNSVGHLKLGACCWAWHLRPPYLEHNSTIY